MFNYEVQKSNVILCGTLVWREMSKNVVFWMWVYYTSRVWGMKLFKTIEYIMCYIQLNCYNLIESKCLY